MFIKHSVSFNTHASVRFIFSPMPSRDVVKVEMHQTSETKCIGQASCRRHMALGARYGLDVYVPPNVYVEALTPSVMLLEVVPLGGI